MKLAVTAEEARMDAPLDEHFAKCAFWILIDTEGADTQFVPNPGKSLCEGKCTTVTRFLADQDVECVLMRKCGAKARERLAAAGIRMMEGCEGSVQDAVQHFVREQEPA